MNYRTLFAALIGLGLVGATVGGGLYVWRGQRPAFCELSGRPIHGNMHVLVQVNGKKLHACCPRCPFTLAAQEGKRVRLLEVTDYVTGRALAPSKAYFVDGSRVEVCTAPRMKLDETRTAYVRLFDRCGPSLLAFAREDEARDFIARFGGRLKRLDALLRPAASQQSPAGEPPND